MLLDDDVRSGAKLPDGELKKLSEAKLVSAERKYGHSFNFVALTVPVLLCNNPPSLADLSRGMMRRLMVIPFERTFADDSTLFERIWASELPGVLNRAIKGLQRVVRRGWRFKHPDRVAQARRRWLIYANPLPAFLDEPCERRGAFSATSIRPTPSGRARPSRRFAITVCRDPPGAVEEREIGLIFRQYGE